MGCPEPVTALAIARDREAAATWHAEQREAPMHAMRFIFIFISRYILLESCESHPGFV